MNTRYPLTATVRETVGHSAKNLRKGGDIPATVYGKGKDSISLSLQKDAFTTVYKKAGETHLIDLSINGKSHPVLISNVQIHPVTKRVHNVEFLTVNLLETLKTSVSVAISGESPAVQNGIGTIITTLQEVEIETLPTNIPETIIVDVSTLTEVDQEIKVSQLTAPSGVVILSDPDLSVVKVGAIVVEEAPIPAEETAGVEVPQPEQQPTESAEPPAEE